MSENGDGEENNKKKKKVVKAEVAGDDLNVAQGRSLRSGYLSIQNFIHEKKDEIGGANPENFKSIINEFDELHHLVKRPREQVSDAQTLRDLTNTVVASIRVHTAGSITPSVFVSSLVSEYGLQRRSGATESVQIQWKDIGLEVSPLLMIFRGCCTMFGPMNYEVKPPKFGTGSRRSRSHVKAEKVKPEELEISACKEKTETEKNIAMMFDILRKKKKVELENIILNRSSFAQTVENLFALSFLVKDGRVLIGVDAKGSHHVSPRNAPDSRAVMSGEVVYCHFIFRFGYHDWKLMKDSVAKGSELMPHRTKAGTVDGPATRTTPTGKRSRIHSRAAQDGLRINESREDTNTSSSSSKRRRIFA